MPHAFKILVSCIILSLLGLAVIPLLPVDLNPSVKESKTTIRYSLPQAAPQLVEQEATAPLENIFSQLSDVKKIYSVSNYNSGNIEITFDENVDLEYKKFEIGTLIRQVYPKLNPELSYPTVSSGARGRLNQSPLLVYQIKGPLASYQIKKIAEENILVPLSQLKGVDKVVLNGAEDIQITIKFDDDLMQKHSLTQQAIAADLQQYFQINYPGLHPTRNNQMLLVKSGNALQDIDQLKEVILNTTTEGSLRLKDLAHVYIEESEARRYYRVSGLNSITLSVYTDEAVNKVALADKIYEKANVISQNLPQAIEMVKNYDDTDFLRKELDKIYQRAGLSILILTLFIFLINRNWRYLSTLFSGILINLLLTSLAAWVLEINIHLYSIAGLTIAFGLVVDNSIVMIDHLYKKKNRKIFTALLGASVTTIASLMIVFFLPEEEKNNLFEFAQIIAISLAISLLVAFFYTPAAFYLLGVNDRMGKDISFRRMRKRAVLLKYYFHSITFIARFRKSFIVLVVFGFGVPVFLLPSKWEDHNWYNTTIGSDVYQEDIRPVADKLFGGALRLFVRNVFEKSIYRTPEKTQLYVRSSLPQGSTIHQMNDVLLKVEDYLSTVEGIEEYVTQISSGQYGSITIEFKADYEKGALPYQLKSRLIARSLDWGGVEWNIFGVGRGFSNNSADGLPNFRVMLKGYNYDELQVQGSNLANKLLTHKRIQEVNTNERLNYSERSSDQLTLNLDARSLINQRINSFEILNVLKERAKPSSPQMYLTLNNSTLPVYLVSNQSENYNEFQLQNGSLKIDSSRSVRMNDVAKLNTVKTANAIHKENRQYLRVVGFEYFGSYKFGNEYLDKTLALQKSEMPIGYTAEKLSFEWDWNKTKRQYGLLLILLVAIYFICGILFENLKQPLYIIACVPISLIGLFLIFSMFDFYFDQGGYAAFVMLGGLVVNAAIFVINDLNNTTGRNYNKNIIKAVMGKAQPILLTILSTCFGLIPFLIEGQQEVFWFSLAIGTIGGLLFSLVAVFVCLPVFLVNSKVEIENSTTI